MVSSIARVIFFIRVATYLCVAFERYVAATLAPANDQFRNLYFWFEVIFMASPLKPVSLWPAPPSAMKVE